MTKRLTEEEVIKRCQDANDNKYIYKNINYQGREKTINVICPIHGEFEIKAEYHMNGVGCPKCRMENQLTLEKFLILSKENHPNNFNDYDYSLITEEVFEKKKKHLPIICKKCGKVFIQSMYKHIKGANCTNCMYETNENKIKKAIEKFGEQIDFSKAKIDNKGILLNAYCKKCNIFFNINYYNLMKHKFGCPSCYKKTIVTDNESFIKKARMINHDMYDYSNVVYKGAHEIIYPKCKRCGKEFPVLTYAHLNGSGCPYCNRGTSKLEEELKHFLIEKHISFEEQKTFPWSKEGRKIFKYDFFLNDYNCLIECQGKQHFRLGGWTKNKEKKEITFNDIERRDKEKLELAKLNKIKLFYFSNLHIEYPYKVYEDKEQLLSDILSFYKENINI